MRWYARLPNGDVEAMTLDELDVAYGNGVVDANTLVLAPDATEWVQLGELASLDEAQPTDARRTADSDAPISVPPPRAKPKWVAPLAFATVAAAACAGAPFAARQAGAFSRRHAAGEGAPSEPQAPKAVAAVPSAVGIADRMSHPAPTEREKPAKRSPLPSAATTGSSPKDAGVFTSGGNALDPLNADLP